MYPFSATEWLRIPGRSIDTKIFRRKYMSMSRPEASLRESPEGRLLVYSACQDPIAILN